MKSVDALQEFERRLAAGSVRIELLTVGLGCDAMLDFYRSVRADDTRIHEDGDMLLFQWGTFDLGQGPRFEVDITRQLIRAAPEADDIWQLSLTFVFASSPVGKGNRWCATLAELDDFAAFIKSHPTYALSNPLAVELDFEPAS